MLCSKYDPHQCAHCEQNFTSYPSFNTIDVVQTKAFSRVLEKSLAPVKLLPKLLCINWHLLRTYLAVFSVFVLKEFICVLVVIKGITGSRD